MTPRCSAQPYRPRQAARPDSGPTWAPVASTAAARKHLKTPPKGTGVKVLLHGKDFGLAPALACAEWARSLPG